MATTLNHSQGASMTTTTSLLDRIQWILEHRNLTHEKLAKQAGFESRTQASSIMSRLKVDPEYPGKMSFRTYERLAKGGRVSLHWLVFGEGKPDQSDVAQLIPTTFKFPNFTTAMQYEGARWQESTIRTVMLMNWTKDKEPKVWTQILDELESDMSAFRAKFEKKGG
jgi:hypothetical protein